MQLGTTQTMRMEGRVGRSSAAKWFTLRGPFWLKLPPHSGLDCTTRMLEMGAQSRAGTSSVLFQDHTFILGGIFLGALIAAACVGARRSCCSGSAPIACSIVVGPGQFAAAEAAPPGAALRLRAAPSGVSPAGVMHSPWAS